MPALSLEKRHCALLEKALRTTCPAGVLTDGGKVIFFMGYGRLPCHRYGPEFFWGHNRFGVSWNPAACSGGRRPSPSPTPLNSLRRALYCAQRTARRQALLLKKAGPARLPRFPHFRQTMNRFIQTIARAKSFGATDAPLYIWGAKGTGKTCPLPTPYICRGGKKARNL